MYAEQKKRKSKYHIHIFLEFIVEFAYSLPMREFRACESKLWVMWVKSSTIYANPIQCHRNIIIIESVNYTFIIHLKNVLQFIFLNLWITVIVTQFCNINNIYMLHVIKFLLLEFSNSIINFHVTYLVHMSSN